jgi:uncharacterized membrane protein YfcA
MSDKEKDDKLTGFKGPYFWQTIVTILIVAVLSAVLLWFQRNDDQTPVLAKILASVITVLLGMFATVVLAKMFCGPIDLRLLVSEQDGSASMSRFQFLIFTFVIATSYLLLASKASGMTLVEVPNGVLGLIGISGGSYVGSKVVQKASETSQANADATTATAQANATTARANADAAQANARAAGHPG